ncbi:MAG: sigma-54 interaction domain-containing protein [Bacteroidia bacterium]
MTIQDIKQRFGIIGNSPLLDHAIKTAMQVAPTDITVLIQGESGVGKESFPQIIHSLSARKHGAYIAVNCGAIPEGTIDSELFGHEKGSFTGAHEARKGYFEVVNSGTIFLDEVAELPISTQVRLLRVLETGEFFKVGSSKVQKTDVRVVAASNVNIPDAINRGKFREDLYYRLNTVPIFVPPLRARKDDILLLFRKFAFDFSERYKIPALSLSDDAKKMIADYRWPGNIRQLKNVTEQMSILETDREISSNTIAKYLPPETSQLPVLFKDEKANEFSERDLLYKVLFDMKKDIVDLKKLVVDLIHNADENFEIPEGSETYLNKLYQEVRPIPLGSGAVSRSNEYSIQKTDDFKHNINDYEDSQEVEEESLSLEDKEKELIEKALDKHKGKRKYAARELGISERTLYRKLKEYNLAL